MELRLTPEQANVVEYLSGYKVVTIDEIFGYLITGIEDNKISREGIEGFKFKDMITALYKGYQLEDSK